MEKELKKMEKMEKELFRLKVPYKDTYFILSAGELKNKVYLILNEELSLFSYFYQKELTYSHFTKLGRSFRIYDNLLDVERAFVEEMEKVKKGERNFFITLTPNSQDSIDLNFTTMFQNQVNQYIISLDKENWEPYDRAEKLASLLILYKNKYGTELLNENPTEITASIGNGSLISNKNDFNLIQEGIKEKLNKKIIGLNLLFKCARDGDQAYIFHTKCDNIPNTITIIKTDKKKRFGGFTTQAFEKSEVGIWKEDLNSFLFSFDTNKNYYIRDDEPKALYCHTEYCSFFGWPRGDLYVKNRFLSQGGCEFYSPQSYLSKGSGHPFSDEEYFRIEDMEVYSLILS